MSSAEFALCECDVLFVCMHLHVDRCLSIRVCSVGVFVSCGVQVCRVLVRVCIYYVCVSTSIL